MTGRNDGSNRPDEQRTRNEAEERKRQEEEAARARRRRLGHAGAAAAGTAAGAVASGAVSESGLIDELTGDDASAAESEEGSPSLDIFDDIVQERTEEALASAREVLERIESAGTNVAAGLGDVAAPDVVPIPDLSAPSEAAAESADAPGPPAGSSRPPAISRPGPPGAESDGADGGIAADDANSPGETATETGAPEPPGAAPAPSTSTEVDDVDAPAPPGAPSPIPPPPAFASPAPPVAPSPTPAGGPENDDAPPPPPGGPDPSTNPESEAAPPPAGEPVPPPPGSSDPPDTPAAAAPAGDPGPPAGPSAASETPAASAPSESENAPPQPPASSTEPGTSTPDDPDVPPPPDPDSSPPPVGSDPPPGSSTDGEDVVVDVDPGGPPPPETDFPEPPQSSGPPDDDTSSPGAEPAPPPPSDGDASVRYLGAENTYAHPADIGEPVAVYDDYPLGPDGPVSVALYEGGASVVTYPNGNYYVSWHVDEHLNPVAFESGGGIDQFVDQRGYNDYAVHISGNHVDVVTESLDTARAFVIEDMDLEGYPGLADPAALGWEPVHEELNEAGQLVRYYETPEGEQIVHTVQRTDEMIVNIVYPNGVMVEKLEWEDEPYIYLWDEEEGDWQQVVWDEDYGGYLPAVWDPAAGEYVPVPPEAEYTYEELLADWEGQELYFPDAIGYIGIAGEASLDPHAMIELYGEPEITEGNGYYELTWHIGADGDIEMTQRLYNDGSGRVSVEFEDWVRATWVDGEPTVEVYYQGAWSPTIYVEEWGVYYYSTPDPYTGEPMLAAFDPETETFVPGILNEAGDWTVPAAYDAESGQWVEAVWDLSVNAYVPVEDAVHPAHWDDGTDAWVADDPDYVAPNDESDLSGGYFGPDGDYQNPGDVANVLFEAQSGDDAPIGGNVEHVAYYDNGAVATTYANNGATDFRWYIDDDGNPADFSDLPGVLSFSDFNAYLQAHGYHLGYRVRIDEAGELDSSGAPWDYAGLDLEILGLEGTEWLDPLAEYGAESATMSFDDSNYQVIHTWTVDGTTITRTLGVSSGSWSIIYEEPDGAWRISGRVGDEDAQDLYVWSEEQGGWQPAIWDEHYDAPMPTVYHAGTEEYVPAIWDENAGQYVPVIWDEQSGSYVEAGWDPETGEWEPLGDVADLIDTYNRPVDFDIVGPFGIWEGDPEQTFGAGGYDTYTVYEDRIVLHYRADIDGQQVMSADKIIWTDGSGRIELLVGLYDDAEAQYGEWPADAEFVAQARVVDVNGEQTVELWHESTGEWISTIADPAGGGYLAAIEVNGELVPAIWDYSENAWVETVWDLSVNRYVPVEDAVEPAAWEDGQWIPIDVTAPQYADDYIPDETYIPEVLDPIHPDTVLLRYPDGSLHEFGFHETGQRYHYMIDEQTGYAVEITGQEPYLMDVGPPPIFEFNETNHVLQPDGTMLVETGTPNPDYVIHSLDAGEGIVVTQTDYPNGAIREYDLDGSTTYVTYVYPDGTRSAREVSDDMQLLSVDEASGTATFIDEDGDVVRLDGSGYKTILSLSSDSAADYDLVNYELPEDPAYYAWDEAGDGWEPYEDPNALDDLIDDAEPPNYPGYDADAHQNYAPQLLESPHEDMVRLQFPDGTVHEFDYDGNHYLIHDAGGADEYAQLVEGGPELYPSYGGMVQFRLPTETGYHSLYIDTATGEVVTPTAIQSVEFDAENGVVRYAYNDRTDVYDLNGDETWWSYQPTGGEWSEPSLSPGRQLLEIQEGPPPRALFLENDGSIRALESDGDWTYLTVSDEYASNMGMDYHDYENYELSGELVWDEETGGWVAAENGDADGLTEYLGEDGATYANPFLVIWDTGEPEQLDPTEVADLFGWETPQAAYFFPNGSVGAQYADGTYRVAWLEDATGEPILVWQQAASGLAYVDYQVYVDGQAVTAEVPAGSALPISPDSGDESDGEFSVGFDEIQLEDPPSYPGYDPSAYPDNDVAQVLQPADVEGYRAQLSDGETYEWTADGAMYHIQVDADGREYATAVSGGPALTGYVDGLAQFSTSSNESYLIDGGGQIQHFQPEYAIQEIDAEHGYVSFGAAALDLRGDQTYIRLEGSDEWVPHDEAQILALYNNPPVAILRMGDNGGIVAIAEDGTTTHLWMPEIHVASYELDPGEYALVDGAEPLYYIDGSWLAMEEVAPEEADETAVDPDEDPQDEVDAVDTTAYLGPDGASYPHPYWVYDSSPVVDAAETAELLSWPQGSAAYLYPGGELVMQYANGTTRVAWLENTETGAPVASFDEIANGQAVIDYAVQADANGQPVSTSVPPGADDPIAGWTNLFSINNAEEEPGTEGSEEGAGGEEEEMEPIDFSEEAPPEEPEEGDAPPDEGESAEEPESEDEASFAQPEAEADPAAGLDPVPGTDEDGLPPGTEDTKDDIVDDDDGLP